MELGDIARAARLAEQLEATAALVVGVGDAGFKDKVYISTPDVPATLEMDREEAYLVLEARVKRLQRQLQEMGVKL